MGLVGRKTWAPWVEVGLELPDYERYERKPVIRHMWFDEDGRLWVLLWYAEEDTVYRAHVYDGEGTHLYDAEWPRGVALSRGGVSGNVALGVRELALGIHQVVRLKFRPVEPSEGK